MVDEFHEFRRLCDDIDIDCISGLGWPLRPFFFDRAFWTATARAIHRLITTFSEHLSQSFDVAAAEGALPPELLRWIDFEGTFRAPQLWDLARPDGFLSERGFELTELNAGNGTLLSTTYTESLWTFYQGIPGYLEPQWVTRPFQGLIEVLRHRAGRRDALHLAFFVPTSDLNGAEEWGARVHKQFGWAPRLLAEAGITVETVHEDTLRVLSDGSCEGPSGRPFDLVFGLTTCLGLFEGPLLDQRYAWLRSGSVGRVPWMVPPGAFVLEKGCLPALARFAAEAGDLARGVTILPTERPQPERAAHYRWHKDDFVLKRAFVDKDTTIGRGTSGRQWNQRIERVLGERSYVLQQFRELPRAHIPFLTEADTIEWIDVVTEVSPFIFGGRFAGLMVRYAPVSHAPRLSPPPPDMGFGVGCVV